MWKLIAKSLILLSLLSPALSAALSQELNGAAVVNMYADAKKISALPKVAPLIAEPASKPRVLKFYANWCAPCRLLKPIVEKVAKRFGNRVEVVEIDIDVPDNRKLMKAYGVTQLPSLIFQTGNGVQFMTVGTLSEEDVTSDIKQIIRENHHPKSANK